MIIVGEWKSEEGFRRMGSFEWGTGYENKETS